MNFLRRLVQRFNRETPPDPLDIHLEEARRARMTERYDDAAQALDDAIQIAQERRDSTTEMDINLRRGDILIAQKRYAEAKRWLGDLRETCEATQHRVPLAYTLSALGQVALAQGETEKARTLYAKARQLANDAVADGAAGRATAHLGDLYLREDNASYALHLLQEAVPRLEGSGDLELLGYFMGRTGQAMVIMGQHHEGLREIQRGLETAVHLQNRPHIRWLSRILGEYAERNSDLRLAKHYYEDALALYPESHLPLAEHTQLQIAMSRVLSQLGQSEAALQQAEKAQIHAATFGLETQAQLALGEAYFAMGNRAKAQQLLQNLDDHLQALPHEQQVDSLRTLAKLSDDYDEATQRYQQALGLAKADEQRAELHEALARLHERQGHWQIAREAWSAAQKAYEAAQRQDDAVLVACALGANYARLGEGRMAKRHYSAALEQLHSVANTVKRGQILASVATAYSDYGPVESALDFFVEAIEIARRADDPYGEALRRSLYGRLLALTGQPKQAVTEIMQARNLSNDKGYTHLAAQQTSYLGLAYTALADHNKALELYQEALTALQKLDAQADVALIQAYVGEAQQAIGDDLAKTSFVSALQIAQGQPAIMAQIRAEIGLSQFEDAQTHLQAAEALAKRAQLQRELARIAMQRSHLLAASDDKEAAQSAWDTASKLRMRMQMPALEPDWL